MAQGRTLPWAIVAIGFWQAAGSCNMDRTLPHAHLGLVRDQAEGVKTGWQRSVLLVLAIARIIYPRGSRWASRSSGRVGRPFSQPRGRGSAALGLGIQNFPKGPRIDPLRREFSRARHSHTGGVGHRGAVRSDAGRGHDDGHGAGASALAFAAGAMIYVVVEGSFRGAAGRRGLPNDIATLGCMAGFAVMMILDARWADFYLKKCARRADNTFHDRKRRGQSI